MNRPYGMLAELTYACPLHCPYCSNPLNLTDYREELSTAEWQRVLAEARELGVLQLHLSGGEPLQRRDLVELVASARDLGLYTNLITSALGLSLRRAQQLKAAGLDHVQISIQADEQALSDRIAGTPSYERKIAGGSPGQGAGLAAHFECGPPPPQHRQDRPHPGSGRGVGSRSDRAGQYPVLRMGLAQPRSPAAQQGPARPGRGGGTRRAPAPAGEDADNLRHPRLLQQVPQTLYGRLGPAAANGDAQRACPTLPRGAHPRSSPGRRARALAGMDLGGVARLPTLPGNGVDARALPEL